MATTIQEHVFLTDNNSVDVGFTKNGSAWSEPISRIVVKLYEKIDLNQTPITIDSDDDEQQDAFDYTDTARIIFSFGNLAVLQGKGGKSYYAEVRLYNAEGKKVRVTAVKGTSDLPVFDLTLHDVV